MSDLRCPSCGRPVAVARETCLYCGAALPATAVEAAQAARTETLKDLERTRPASADGGGDGEEGPARALVVMDLSGVSAPTLAQALGVLPFEAGQRLRRGGVQLLRIAPVEDATREVARLGRAGVPSELLAEDEVRALLPPFLVLGARWREGALHLRGTEDSVVLGPEDLLLVVSGTIERGYQTADEPRRVRTATLDPGWRVHLHRRVAAPPLELDPAVLDFEGEVVGGGSSILQVRTWLERLSGGRQIDDGFRRLTPVMAPAEATPGPAGSLQASRPKDAPTILDNAAQFRFYSAWRGLWERRRS